MNPVIEEMEAEVRVVAADSGEEVNDGRTATSPDNGKRGGRPPATKAVADSFIAAQGTPFPFRRHRGEWFCFDGTIYRPMTGDDMRGRIIAHLRNNRPEHATKNMVMNVAENLQAYDVAGVESRYPMPCWLPSGEAAAGWIATRNCLVNVEALARRLGGGTVADADVTRPHTPQMFSTFALPYDYAPDADCPKWRDYLLGVQPDEQMRVVLQMLAGLALVPDCSYETFFILFGEGGCGKSVYLHVLEHLVGPSNVCTLPLSKFSEKHSTHLLTQYLLNIVGDLPTNDGRGSLHAIEGILKDVSSGALLSCEPKNVQPYKAHAIARCIFATNSLPTFADRTSGIWDRLRVIPFDVRFRGTDKQNPRLKDEIVAEELPGVFMWAVEGLAMLRRMRQFPRGPRGEEIEARHRADCDHERQYLVERYESRKGAFVESQPAYSGYRTWCQDSGYRPKNMVNFVNDLRRVFPGVLEERRRIEGRQVRGFFNLSQIVELGGGL